MAAAVHWCGRRVLYRRAAEADVALADGDRDAREQYVVLSRSIEHREHERLLHDTVRPADDDQRRDRQAVPGTRPGKIRARRKGGTD